MKRQIVKGVVAVISLLLVFVIAGAAICYDNVPSINNYLGISTGKIVNPDGVEGELYYRSSYGDGTFSAENLDLLIADTYAHNVQEMEEGAVLLKNDNAALPLKAEERKVDLFGQYVDRPLNMGSGDYNIDLKQALTAENFILNGNDSDIAIIMFSRSAGEGSDLKIDNGSGVSSLALQESEQKIIRDVKSSGKYKKTILLINSANPIELGWLYEEELSLDAALWIGGPGLRGFTGVANLLTGKANPSGRLTDTYAADSTSAPACVNGGTNSPRWTNATDLQGKVTDLMSSVAFYSVQAENIYVGYKYYETRYEDAVLGQGNATSSAGASNGASVWDYANEVTYPFGYGLSYTTFSQTLESVVEEKNGDYTVRVSVKNTGDVAGKSVVQVYAQTPYGEYEKTNLVEKSAVQLVGFSKSDLLEPEQEAVVEVTVRGYFLASYDYVSAKGYILSAGDYYLAVGSDCHDALNNILACKEASGMTDAQGNPEEGDADMVYGWTLDVLDADTYRNSAVTEQEVTNLFGDCDINYWVDGAVTYLSRSDWDKTYPREVTQIAVTEEMIDVLDGEEYEKPADAPDFNSFEIGVDKGITALQMMDVDYDDAKWDDFISQLTLEELTSLLSGAFTKDQISSIVLPSYFSGDGINKLSASFSSNVSNTTYTGTACRYCDENVLASTWNTELYENRGKLMGEEMLFCGFYQLYGPGSDLHRTPFGGRNNEYCSEDANLTYIATTAIMQGLRTKGVAAQIKHLAGNDQEYNRAGISLFFTEQAWREGSLRGFEGAFTEGGAVACMNGLNRIGLRWTNASEALCTGVLRGEWGLKGTVGTDGISSRYQTHFTTGVNAGTDSYCLDNKGSAASGMLTYLRESKDGYMLQKVREAAKHNLYPIVNSMVMNNLTAESRIDTVVPWWQSALTAVIVILSVLDAAAIAGSAALRIRALRKGKEEDV